MEYNRNHFDNFHKGLVREKGMFGWH